MTNRQILLVLAVVILIHFMSKDHCIHRKDNDFEQYFSSQAIGLERFDQTGIGVGVVDVISINNQLLSSIIIMVQKCVDGQLLVKAVGHRFGKSVGNRVKLMASKIKRRRDSMIDGINIVVINIVDSNSVTDVVRILVVRSMLINSIVTKLGVADKRLVDIRWWETWMSLCGFRSDRIRGNTKRRNFRLEPPTIGNQNVYTSKPVNPSGPFRVAVIDRVNDGR